MLALHNGQMGTVSNCAVTHTWLKQGQLLSHVTGSSEVGQL